ncbi:hypothetical protein [Polluticaenibacter yanchengensis]|uniref:Lasso RiPP family leader peptide-containing protein n=1 Tax=Polluticaenibacter yanchengensis TaxID=3014562 RepID=A0ABT4UIC6_9BACT|nr:hypothetical protein [Chitinophagaceae bacterium LY-5]
MEQNSGEYVTPQYAGLKPGMINTSNSPNKKSVSICNGVDGFSCISLVFY